MDYYEMGLQPLEVEEAMVVELYFYLHIYGEKVARLLVELEPEHAWQPLQQSQVGVAQLDLQVHVDSVEEAAMVAEVQEDVYHGEALLQDAQEPKMDHHEMGLQLLEDVGMVEEVVGDTYHVTDSAYQNAHGG
ncbi:hypothetical protein BU17DRAFT_69722 [Hysterangium stoloniferum]|nr:hypothetical protein BU17DRAFT_69722 [Hysterangium stoloniferum]